MSLLKLVFRNWKVAPVAQASIVFSMTAIFFIIGMFADIYLQASPVITRVENENVITAYISPEVPDAKISDIVDSIETSLGAAGVKNVQVESFGVHKFVDYLRETQPALAKEIVQLGSEMDRLVPRFASVSGVFDQKASEIVRGVAGIESIDSSRNRLRQVSESFLALKWIGIAVCVALLLMLMVIIVYVGKLYLMIQREVFSLMKLLGGGLLLVSFPPILSMMVTGIVGGALAVMIWLSSREWVLAQLQGFSPVFAELSLSSNYVAWIAAGLVSLGSAIGGISGFVCSLFQENV